MSIKAYFDGSHKGHDWFNGDVVSLAGIATSDLILGDFDKGWDTILKGRGIRPTLKNFHAVDAANGNPPFDASSGWKSSYTEQIIIEFLEYMQKFDKLRFRSFACTIDLQAHRKVLMEKPLKPPLEMCINFCPWMVLAWIVAKYPDVIHSANFFFDQTEPFRDAFKQRWEQEKNKIFCRDGMDYFWSIIKSVTETDMRDHPALQAADLLAWASTRLITHNEKPDRFKNLLPFVRLIVPSTWSVWREEELRTGRQRQNP